MDNDQATNPPEADAMARRLTEAEAQRHEAHLAALRRLAYHDALHALLGKVNDLVHAVDAADLAHRRTGEADSAPMSPEEQAVFAASQTLLADLVMRHPGAAMLFPRIGAGVGVTAA